jgi:hypothetical protein
VLRTRPTARGRAAAAAVLVLAFLAKQSVMFATVPLVAFILWDAARGARSRVEWLRGAPAALIVGLGIAGSVGILDATSDGWYRFYVFGIPPSYGINASMWTSFWTSDIAAPLGCAALGAVFVLRGAAGLPVRSRALWAAALVAAVGMAWAGRLHPGGWRNVLMPATAILAALFVIALHAIFTLAGSTAEPRRRRLRGFVGDVAVIQFLLLLYDPRTVVPTARDEAAGWKVVAALRDAPGDTFVPTDSYLTVLAGKRPHLHQMAMEDVLNPQTDVSRKLADDLHRAFRERRWAMVITDNEFFADDVLQNYARGPSSVAEPDTMYPVTGVHYRPGFIYRPK